MEQQNLARINELAKIAKTRELTPAEQEERARLRKEYLAEFRKAFQQQPICLGSPCFCRPPTWYGGHTSGE